MKKATLSLVLQLSDSTKIKVVLDRKTGNN